MPPKKANSKAKRTASLDASKALQGSVGASTAAASRSRRVSTVVEASVPTQTPAMSNNAPAPKKRGRPAKPTADEPPSKRSRGSSSKVVDQDDEDIKLPAPTAHAPALQKRGRPPKSVSSAALKVVGPAPGPVSSAKTQTTKKRGRPSRAVVPAENGGGSDHAQAVESAAPVAKKRGRPSKAAAASKDAEVSEEQQVAVAEPAPKKRGRPSKASALAGNSTKEEEHTSATPAPTPKKRGRPSKGAASSAAPSKPAPAVPLEPAAPPKKRGRPPKGGETTRVKADDEAAAEQLEDELLEGLGSQQLPESRSTEPAMSTKRKGKAPVKRPDTKSEDNTVATKPAVSDEAPSSGKQYWLMKAEQEDRFETLKSGRQFNTKFTIDDLRSKTEPEPWDGVRNAVAAKNMRAMQPGDLAFFYASGGKAGRKPGITGIMEIVRAHEPDATAWDEDAYGFVEKAADRARWCVVHVAFRRKLAAPVPLHELQKHGEANGVLAGMQVLATSRLSVTRVDEREWDFIVENLIEGYDDDDDDHHHHDNDGAGKGGKSDGDGTADIAMADAPEAAAVLGDAGSAQETSGPVDAVMAASAESGAAEKDRTPLADAATDSEKLAHLPEVVATPEPSGDTAEQHPSSA